MSGLINIDVGLGTWLDANDIVKVAVAEPFCGKPERAVHVYTKGEEVYVVRKVYPEGMTGPGWTEAEAKEVADGIAHQVNYRRGK